MSFKIMSFTKLTLRGLFLSLSLTVLAACGSESQFQPVAFEKTSGLSPIDPDSPLPPAEDSAASEDVSQPPPNPQDADQDPSNNPPATVDPRQFLNNPRFLYGKQKIGSLFVEAEKNWLNQQCQIDLLIEKDGRRKALHPKAKLAHCRSYILAEELAKAYGACQPTKKTHRKINLLGKFVTEWATYITEDCLCYSEFNLKTPFSQGTIALSGKASVCKTLSGHYADAQLTPVLSKINSQYGF